MEQMHIFQKDQHNLQKAWNQKQNTDKYPIQKIIPRSSQETERNISQNYPENMIEKSYGISSADHVFL